MRPWYRIHFSTVFVLAFVLAWMVFINIPGDGTLRDTGQFHHGWPYLYFERKGGARSWWSFAGTSPEFHVDALLLNVVTALCIAALVAFACELWIRRFGRLLRFSIASLMFGTAILAMIMGLVVHDVHRCYRQQRTLDELAKLGSVQARRDERKYDWFRSLFGSDFDGTIKRIDVKAGSPTGAVVPDLSALDGLEFLNLEGVILGEEDVAKLATAPKLETLILDVRAVRGNRVSTIGRLSELEIKSYHLSLNSELFDDGSVSSLTRKITVTSLAINSSHITERTFRHVSKIKSLEELHIAKASLRDADFSPLATAPKLKLAVFVGCKLSPADESKLLSLWPDGNLAFFTTPNGKAVQAFAANRQR